MAREIVEVEESEPKKKKKKSIDLSKITEIISENSDTIEMIAGTLLSNSTKKSSKSKKGSSTKKTTTKKRTSTKSKTSDNDTLSTAMNIFGSLLKK